MLQLLLILCACACAGCAIAVGSTTACLTGAETYVSGGGYTARDVGDFGQNDSGGNDVRGGVSLYWDFTGACEEWEEVEPDPPSAEDLRRSKGSGTRGGV